jgi:hypothetical protein
MTITQRRVAVALVSVAILLAVSRSWPFDAAPPRVKTDEPSLWQFLLADRLTLGFVRLGLAMSALFVVASIPALIVGGRWLRGFGPSGLIADDAADAAAALARAQHELAEIREELEAVEKERDEARAALKAVKPPGGNSGDG